jgi:hypothetical protein
VETIREGGFANVHAAICCDGGAVGEHYFRKASRSALIVSACVVGIPCGKPL